MIGRSTAASHGAEMGKRLAQVRFIDHRRQQHQPVDADIFSGFGVTARTGGRVLRDARQNWYAPPHVLDGGLQQFQLFLKINGAASRRRCPA